MISALAVTVGLLTQAGRAPDPVRIWRADSIAYVALREPGYLLVLHVDPIGRISVLSPLTPDDRPPTSNGRPVAVELPPTAQGNPSTFVAVRSRWPFDFTAVRWGSWWNYQDALLLQPTAGDPLAALLEIADRVTDGRPYDYGVMLYSRDGSVAARRQPLQPAVCLGCVRRRTPIAAAPAPIPVQSNSVDCSNATLTNSFCGVATGSVSITSVPAQQAAYQPPQLIMQAPVYVPYYVPIVVHQSRRMFEQPPPRAPAPQPSHAVGSPIAPRLVVPSSAQWRSFGKRRS